MRSYHWQQNSAINQDSKPWKDQNWRVPRTKFPQLLLQCENGLSVPLIVVPEDVNQFDGNVQIVAPVTGCGLGVFGFPKPSNTNIHGRPSTTPGAERNLSAAPAYRSLRGASLTSRKIPNEKSVQSSTNDPATPSNDVYCPTPKRVQSDTAKKEYCSYWIRHGECDFMQQGCRYKHEMPDLHTLQRIGFRDFPVWWKHGVSVRPLGPQNDSLGNILAQKSDTESSSSEDALSEAFSLNDEQRPFGGSIGAHLGIIQNCMASSTPPDSSNLIDFEPLKPRTVESEPAYVASRQGRFIPHSELQRASSGSPSSVLPVRSLPPIVPPLRLDSPFTLAPTVPHSTPILSPQLKLVESSPRKEQQLALAFGKFPAANVASSEPPAAAIAAVAAANAATVAMDRGIKPAELQRQIENLQRFGHNAKQPRYSSRVCSPNLAAKQKKTGLGVSKYAGSPEFERAEIDTMPKVEKGKDKRSRKTNQLSKAAENSCTPAYHSARQRPRKVVRAAATMGPSNDEMKSSGPGLL